MTHFDDYPSDMSSFIPHQRPALDDNAVEALLGARSTARSEEFGELASVLTELRRIVEVPAPAPSLALAAILEQGIPAQAAEEAQPAPRPAPMRRRVRRAIVVTGIGSMISLPLMGVAAAQDRLPDAAQHVVARVINATTPFTVTDPRPDATGDKGSTQKQQPRKSRQRTPASPLPGPGDPSLFVDPAEEFFPDDGLILDGTEEDPVVDGVAPGDSADTNATPDPTPSASPSDRATTPPTSNPPTPTPTPSAEPTPSALEPPVDSAEQSSLGDSGEVVGKSEGLADTSSTDVTANSYDGATTTTETASSPAPAATESASGKSGTAAERKRPQRS